MAEVFQILKNSEKVLLWLFRQDLTMAWLAKELEQSAPSVSQKIKRNGFTDKDLAVIKRLGCPL
jgi:hypothetical protein